jgi:hypothetical protein
MFPVQLVIIVACATIIWVAVTLLTGPVDEEVLKRFYRKVRPGGWWGSIAAKCPEVVPDRSSRGWPYWFAGTGCIYCALFGLGSLFLARYGTGLILLLAAAGLGYLTLKGALALTPGNEAIAATDTARGEIDG